MLLTSATPRVASSLAVGRGSGVGGVELAVVAGKTAVVARRASSPLKLLTPRGFDSGAARVVVSSYGGGLVAGDDLKLSLHVGPHAAGMLTTQASTKVYRCPPGARGARQQLDATIADHALLVVAPDPVTCFAGSRYEQGQTFDLSTAASLLLVDWLTSGRAARGERWAFDRYRSDVSIRVNGQLVARDALLLDPADGPIRAPHRAGRFDCLAVAFVVGPRMRQAAIDLLEGVRATPLARKAPVIATASPIADGGVVIRVAGPGAEPVGRTLRSLLSSAFGAAGGDPWARKW